MCDKCELDLLMYGEPVRCAPPVFEKGRFEARPVDREDGAGKTNAGKTSAGKTNAGLRKDDRTARRDEE